MGDVNVGFTSGLSGGVVSTWQSWVPVWTGSTIGNSTVNAKYVQIGKSVWFYINVTVGSTFSMAVGADTNFTLPVTASSDFLSLMSIGSGGTFHSATFNPLYVVTDTSNPTTKGMLQALAITGSSVIGKAFDTANLTLSAADTFNVNGFYQAA